MRATQPVAALIALALLAVPVAAAANAFDDFRIPDNRAFLWTGSTHGSGYWTGETGPGRDNRFGSVSSNLSSDLWWNSDGDARSTSLSLSVTGNGTRQHEDLNSSEVSIFEEASFSRTDRRSLAQSVRGAVSHRSYLAGGPWYVSGGVAAGGDYSQGWSKLSSHIAFPGSNSQADHDTGSTWRYDNNVSATIGGGIGHVRNATGVYEARVLERRLRASGALTQTLSSDTRRRLAALMYGRNDLDLVHDRPGTSVWGAIGHILKADGALRDSAVTAEEWVRTMEPYFTRTVGAGPDLLPTSPVARFRGVTASAVLQLSSGHRLDRLRSGHTFESVTAGVPDPSVHTHWYFRHHASFDAALAGLQVEGHWPLTECVQLDAIATVERDVRPGGKRIQETANAGAAWMIAERWLINARAAHSRFLDEQAGNGVSNNSWRVLVDGSATYFVADHLDASLSVSGERDRNSYGAYVNSWRQDSVSHVDLALTYRFAGFASISALQPFLAN